jgi:predicted secreted hydrolase
MVVIKKYIYGHFAISDVKNKSFHALTDSAVTDFHWQGHGVPPFKVWLEDWMYRGKCIPMVLSASEKNISIILPCPGKNLQFFRAIKV